MVKQGLNPLITQCTHSTPRNRQSTTPSTKLLKPQTHDSNTVKPNPNYTPPASVKKSCLYETPCGWCTKWDKKCDKKIGCSDSKPQRGLRAKAGCLIEDTVGSELDYIRSGKGLPPIGTNNTHGLVKIE